MYTRCHASVLVTAANYCRLPVLKSKATHLPARYETAHTVYIIVPCRITRRLCSSALDLFVESVHDVVVVIVCWLSSLLVTDCAGGLHWVWLSVSSPSPSYCTVTDACACMSSQQLFTIVSYYSNVHSATFHPNNNAIIVQVVILVGVAHGYRARGGHGWVIAQK